MNVDTTDSKVRVDRFVRSVTSSFVRLFYGRSTKVKDKAETTTEYKAENQALSGTIVYPI
jgi:hypothetical protein